VEVATRVQNDEVVLAVSNTGPFVPAAEVARLFQPFQRLGADRVGRGAGLGLSIVQAISDAHGAALRTRPRPTGGLYIEVAFARASDGVEYVRADRRPPLAEGQVLDPRLAHVVRILAHHDTAAWQPCSPASCMITTRRPSSPSSTHSITANPGRSNRTEVASSTLVAF
jgi:hypothetical protein